MPPAELLVVCPHFPSPGTASDGQAVYLHEAARALHEATGWPIHVAALRIGAQAAREDGGWLSIDRAEPPRPLRSVFEVYEADLFPAALRPMAALAGDLARRLASPVAWCHGYETADALAALEGSGVPTVAVVHYSLAQESLHDLAIADDPVRAAAVGSPLPGLLRWAVPGAVRPAFVRLSSRSARWGRLPLPLPGVLRLQLAKLELERRLFARARRVVAVGESFAGSLGALYPRWRPKLSWCFAGAPPACAEPKRRDGRLRLLMAGRPSLQKGWDYAAAALARIEQESPEVASRLSVALVGGLEGSAFAARVHASFQRLGRVEVRHAGHLSRTELSARYAEADALLHPSVFEPFGLVIVEALAHGCLVAASDTDGPRDLLRPPFGWTFPFTDPRGRVDALTGALRELASLSPAELDRRSALAREAAARFTWAACAQGHLRALRAAADGGSR